MTSVAQRIPVVDLQEVGIWNSEEPSKETWKCVGKQLAEAFTAIGFVYITHHGVPPEVVTELNQSLDVFFQLPVEQKEKLNRGVSSIQGYTGVNREKLADDLSRHELRESYDVNNRNGIFPDDEVPGFRPSVSALLDRLIPLTKRLLTAIEHGLGLEPNYLLSRHAEILTGGSNGSALRLLHYPPVPPNSPPNTVRCSTHTDYGTITLLLQDNMGGLEVRDRTGAWVAATPLPGALLVNIGDLLQLWTNNVFIATEHRVLVPAEEHMQRKARRSIVFFVHPDHDVLVAPIDGSKGSMPPITALDYLNRRFKETYGY